jgi:hypothetical protein
MEAAMGDYPNNPGHWAGAPETSKQAAAVIADAAKSRSALAARYVVEQGFRGATADEVADALDWDRYSSRPRLAELHKRGLIVDSGERRTGVSGRRQAVWVGKQFGPEAPSDPQFSFFDPAVAA